MKIKQGKIEFKPITLTLETEADVEAMLDIVETKGIDSVGGRLLAQHISNEMLSCKYYLGVR